MDAVPTLLESIQDSCGRRSQIITLQNQRPYTQVRGFAKFPELPRLPTEVTGAGLEHLNAVVQPPVGRRGEKPGNRARTEVSEKRCRWWGRSAEQDESWREGNDRVIRSTRNSGATARVWRLIRGDSSNLSSRKSD